MHETTGEQWLPIHGFPGYEVSDLGRVRSYRKPGTSKELRASPKLLKPSDKGGAMKVTFWENSRPFYKTVHRLVVDAFGEQKPNDGKNYVIAHWDGDYTNNHISNLRWATYRENFKDFERHLTERCCIHCSLRDQQ